MKCLVCFVSKWLKRRLLHDEDEQLKQQLAYITRTLINLLMRKGA